MIRSRHLTSSAQARRSRAAQSDTSARVGLESELANLRATLAANGQRAGVGTGAISSAIRTSFGRERRIEFGTAMQQSADYSRQASNAQSAGNQALLDGLIKLGPSLFDLDSYKTGGHHCYADVCYGGC